MAKRKKYPKLPNGFGSIKYLGKGRANPYGVYPPTKEFTLEGAPVSQKALAYVPDWYTGFSVLVAYKAGTFDPANIPISPLSVEDVATANDVINKIISNYKQIQQRNRAIASATAGPTFKEVYEGFFSFKFEQSKRKYADSSKYTARAAFKNCTALHDRKFATLRHNDLQEVVDECTLKHASLELIITLFHGMYSYAKIQEIVDRDYSEAVRINIEDDDESGEPFSDDDLKKLWANKTDPIVEMILIMCYSGFRITAYNNLTVNLSEQYFQGGIKNRTSKNRIVPIHSGILHLVENRNIHNILGCTTQEFRKKMYGKLEELGLEQSESGKKHTPHDCRHTFSRLCQHFKVDELDRKRMLGHSFGGDITNATYGHRTLEELRSEIEKIICC